MKIAIAAALLLTALPVCAVAQTAPLLRPADTNRDGVVSEDEQLDYLARKSVGIQDQPGLPVSAPKAGGMTTIIMGKPGGQAPGSTTAGEPPAAASEFEKATEDRLRQDTRRDE